VICHIPFNKPSSLLAEALFTQQKEQAIAAQGQTYNCMTNRPAKFLYITKPYTLLCIRVTFVASLFY